MGGRPAMLVPDGLEARGEPSDPTSRTWSGAARAAGVTALAWGGSAILIGLLTVGADSRVSEFAAALFFIALAVIVLPVWLVGLIELVIAWRGGRTALAFVATVAGALGCFIAVPLVVGSMVSMAAFLFAIGLATASVVQVAAAVHVLEGRSRLIPIVVAVGAVVVSFAWLASSA